MSNRGLDQERLEYIKGRINSQTQRVELIAWPRAEKLLYKVSLEVDWVRFYTLNHRTRAEQQQKEHSLGQPDLFSADPLGAHAQDVQMQIIASQDGFADLCADIGERGQREPAVVTAEGVLINGNRRVAALRRMLRDDHNLNCKYVQCLVLPDDANHDEILLLETELQIARDFKQEYSWINEALLIEELYEKNARSYQHVAKIMHRSTRDVQDAHDKLKQVYQLVELSQGAKQLADFKDHESAF
ncbi:MAG: ParB/RepB/Spo0J family partition protein [bacterium]|nr:ParB/RepB/Spo0J family partition protein [bacterium]